MAHNTHDLDADFPDGAESPSRPALLQVLWQRKSLVLIGTALCLVLGGLYYAQAAPIYESKAQVLVVQKRPDAVTGVDTRRMPVEDFVSTHQVLIQSRLIIERAIQKRSLASLQMFAERQEDLTTVIEKSLTVTRNRSAGGNNNVLDMICRGKVAEECAVVLDAIIESYKDFLDETYRNMSDDTLELVTRARNVVQTDLLQKEKAFLEFRGKAPLLSKGKDGRNLFEDRLAGIASRRASLLLRRAEIQAQLKAVEKARKDGLPQAALLALVTDFSTRSEATSPAKAATTSLQDQLQPLLSEEQRLLERFGENHPAIVSVRKRIALTRTIFSSPSAAYREGGDSPTSRGKAGNDAVESNVQYVKQQLELVQSAERLLNELFEQEQDEVRKLASYEVEDESRRSDISRTQALYDGIVKRLHDVGLVKVVGGYDAKTIASPGLGKHVSPKAVLVFPFAGMLGVLLGAGLAYLAELTDKSFREVEDVRRQLGLPVVGAIPMLGAPTGEAAREGSLDPLLCTYHQPRSREAEAYRGVRTALYFNTRGEKNKVIQITSPLGGDGKSTLAANLAVSIAQSGKRVLLIDADLRRPRIQKMFGLAASTGLSLLVIGEAGPEAVQESGVGGLWILGAGPIPPNPAELLTSPQFKELLDSLREQYDFVIIDTPPLLAVSDPSVVAPRVDGVLLTIRMVKNGRPAAERAKDVLEGLGATVVGVVVNADRHAGAGTYGYGTYRYESTEESPVGRDLRRDGAAASPSPPHLPRG